MGMGDDFSVDFDGDSTVQLKDVEQDVIRKAYRQLRNQQGADAGMDWGRGCTLKAVATATLVRRKIAYINRTAYANTRLA